ncbi:uncharacterized protein PHACADRAFT_186750 [Phanerochaete carnosa HHB-10118-sp]|uniref:LAA1-like C-terminal TPR repeats domain-containing protein n=1 Tax=Phanerochaete carnosa (strain HHB-10118-sp) TaxID=650164 RepID=K5W161_PHACS|nr:uncharacterized protein PHACADRAFT_186750 [Phanerochaete carnosa HHB-10118-sp]EKM52639.1 hypothetical protein PHACADRAFT_186750 [Phanerochaete carnosa HHB-10118-sp]
MSPHRSLIHLYTNLPTLSRRFGNRVTVKPNVGVQAAQTTEQSYGSTMTESPSNNITSFEESNLGDENGEIYMFQWLGSNERALQQTTGDQLKDVQQELVDQLLKIISAPEPYPAPGRPVRSLVAQCLTRVYTYGETKTLFDTVQTLLKHLDPKAAFKEINKIAALWCIGELMGTFGGQIMSLMVETTTACLRLSKSSNSTIIRYHALLALEKAIRTAKRALTDSLLKDVIKQARSFLSDKSSPVVRAACCVLTLLFPFGDDSKSLPDVEQMVQLSVRQLDTADQLTRHSLSKLVAHVLGSTQMEHAVPVPEAPKQKQKAGGLSQDQDNETQPPAQEMKRLLAPQEMLAQLSVQYNKPNVTRRTRVGIFDCYVSLLSFLGSNFVESNYALIVNHFMTEIVSNPRSTASRYDVLFVRSLVDIVLRDLIGVRTLSEQAQISAIQELSNAYLKRWPAMMPGQTAPNPYVLVVALREVGGLLQQLGNAPTPVQDSLVDPIMTLLTHPVHSVRLNAAWTLRCFCYSTPLRLPKVLLSLVELLQNDLTALTTPAAPSDIDTRILGRAYGLAGLLSVIPKRPLYASYDISANVFYIAVQLLKRAGEHDVKIAKVEIEVAWTLVAALMTLGPNGVRAHLPQLLVLWRNALPKPTTKDGMSGRSAAEWTFLLSVREYALRAVFSFLQHNSPVLLTADVARRITSLLTNALQFANTFASQKVVEETPEGTTQEGRGLSLSATDALFRSRIYQAFMALGVSKVSETTQAALLQFAVSLFASPEGYVGSSVQAAIAASSGAFTSVWQSTDCYAYGVTDIEVNEDFSTDAVEGRGDWLNRDTIHASIDDMCNKPIIRSLEHDPLSVCQARFSESDRQGQCVNTPPAATAAIDEAIQLFSQLLPLQDSASMTRTVAQLVEATGSTKSEKNTGRKAAVLVNSAVALVLALRQASTLNRQIAETIGHPKISAPLADLLKSIYLDEDVVMRKAGSEAIGRLTSLAGTNFFASIIKTLVNEVVNNRNPTARAGCALAFGSVYQHVGGLAAGPLLKTTVHILMSLVNDPHPVVSFWAARALSRVIDAASLAYASFVPSTLGLLFRVYMLESHEPEGGPLNYVNTKGELPLYQALCQAMDAVVTVVGPDIQESARTRSLVLDLVHQFLAEEDDGTCVEAIKCVQHLLIFAPDHIDVPKLVGRFRSYLSSSKRPLKLASINALYQLVQKDVMTLSRLGGDQLVEELFAMLDDDASVAGVRNVIISWLQQTVVYNPSAWIDLCQRIMSRTTASQQAGDTAKRSDIDDEGQSLSIDPTANSDGADGLRSTARWRTQLFALQCLHEICITVSRSSRREHLDIAFARAQGIPLPRLLVSRIADLIRTAFTASAAHVMEIRLEGLTVLRDVIEIFSRSPDPDFDGALLLEQYQAPITAALTPAFSADSTPEILASAIKACAVFVGSGVIKDVTRMGRILKLLTSALEQCQGYAEPGMLRLGEAVDLGPNASVMLRIATLSAWAELQVSSTSQTYLIDVIRPYSKALASLWIGSLRDYASIRAGTELLDDAASGGVDSSYASLGKEVLLPVWLLDIVSVHETNCYLQYYKDAWSIILQAVTTAMDSNDSFIRAAVDGREPTDADAHAAMNGTAFEQPTTFFYVLFGLIFEALATSTPETGLQNIRSTVISLRALKHLVRPQYAGNAFKEVPIFEELVNLCYRMALTEPAAVQVYLVDSLASLADSVAQGERKQQQDSPPPQVHCLRICAYVLKGAIGNTRDKSIQDNATPADRVLLINAGFDAYAVIAAACEPSRNIEYRTVAVALYNDLLTDEISEMDLVGPTLQSLKKLLEKVPEDDHERVKYERVVHGLLSACLLNIDAMRGRDGPMCRKKIKNNVLAAVLVLTILPPIVRLSLAVIEHCCFLISQQLNESSEMALTAAHCAKTLVTTSVMGNPALQHCAGLLLPGMIECVARVAALEGEPTEVRVQIISEIWKAFSALFTSTSEENKSRLLGVLLPTMTLLLDPSRTPPSVLHAQTIAQALTFAAASPQAFKEATTKLPAELRDTLETSVRQALGKKTSASEAHKPQISLRSF